MVGFARVAVAGGCLLALAACGQAAGTTAAPTTASTTVPPASTTAAPSTTSAPTTTLSPQAQDEAAIRELHDRFFRMIVLTGNPPNPDDPEIAATTTGIQRQRSEEVARTMRELGEHSVGDLQGEVREIAFLDADHAAVTECSFDSTTLTMADGSAASTHETDASLTELRTARTSEGWRVEDWFTGGGVKCDL